MKWPLLFVLFVVACTAPIGELPRVPEPVLTQCEEAYITDFFAEKFGVDVVYDRVTKCEYKHLGYGGAYSYNVSVDDTSASIQFSGMGSGGHGSENYCFRSEEYLVTAQEMLCGDIYHEETYNTHSCEHKTTFDETEEMRQACKDGLFTSQNTISFTQSTSRCGYTVKATEPLC